MNMKIGSTIIVLILAVAGVIAMLRIGWDEDGRKTLAAKSLRLPGVSQLPVDELTRIRLQRAGEPAMVFERSGASWNQTQPFPYPMDAFAIRQLAVQARDLEVFDSLDPAALGGGLSAETLALNPPAAEIHYEWSGGSLTLHLGRRSIAGRAYARIKGEPAIYVVDQKVHERALDMDHKEWRSRTIFAEVGIESHRIEWRNGPAAMALERARKQWMMSAPAQTRLDQEARDQYFDALGRAQVSGFIFDQPTENDLAKFGLKDSPVSLTIVGGGTGETPVPPTQRLIIGARAGGGTQDFFGMLEGRPVVVRLSGAVLAALFRQPQELAALTASGVVPADVKSIVVRTNEAELKLQRDLEQWHAMTEARAREVNAAHVQELLDQLTQLRASGVEFIEYPRELEVAIITLHGFDGRAIDTVRVLHDEQTGRWGMENGDNVLRVYPAGLKLRLTAADFEME